MLSENKKSIKAFFHGRGFKCTPQRLTVLRVLEGNQLHLSINEIHARVRKLLPDIGLATVYRALETLEGVGLIIKVHLEDGSHSYAIAPQGHRHPVVCVGCNRVVEFAECPLQEMAEKLSAKTGFIVENHFLQLFGKCEKCQA